MKTEYSPEKSVFIEIDGESIRYDSEMLKKVISKVRKT